ncbi:MAG TPA: glucose-6-phosphate dehydrogenase assembly protein OpcA [Pyrinomonadaceae bacterium]|nr:glucose-6-phosphate dehydrogenase assembly protein OpcA [Pyrinomonadaceae bacterium]
MQIQLEKTLDVEVVERHLAELWRQTSGGDLPDDEFAVLRARVANLLVYVAQESSLKEVNGIIAELTAMHPSRVLLLLGETEKRDHDIELAAETFCQTEKRSGAKRLCCEEITLRASGSFVSELPSAALPLLVPDLTTFLWWRAPLAAANVNPDKVFAALLQASDRLVVDSAEFVDPFADLRALTKLFTDQDYAHVGISDLNWARLTSWRALLAGFYDVPAYQPLLDSVDEVRIDYLAPEKLGMNAGGTTARAAVAPQAVLIAGWLASRLGWNLANDQSGASPADETLILNFSITNRVRATEDSSTNPIENQGSGPTVREGAAARTITLEFHRVEHPEGKPGRLVQVELHSKSASPASFAVARSTDNLHLIAEARVKKDVHRGRVMPVRNRSAAQLLGREMEILCNDRIYQEAIAVGAGLIH